MAGSFDACRVAFVGLVQSEEEKVRALPLYTTPKPAPEVVPSVEVATQPAPEAEATAPNSESPEAVAPTAAETTSDQTAEPIADQTPEATTAITPEEKTPTLEPQPPVEESRPRRRRSAAN